MANLKDFYPSVTADNVEGNVVGDVTGDLLGNVEREVGGAAQIILDNDAALLTGNVDGDVMSGDDVVLDASTGTLTGSLTGNASSASTLNTPREIGGVSFDGSADIDLPGVNTEGNQNTTGSAATATNERSGGPAIKFWSGTQEQYDAIDDADIDNDTLYIIHT